MEWAALTKELSENQDAHETVRRLADSIYKMTMSRSLFKHDCVVGLNKCIFLGQYHHAEADNYFGIYDLYFCTQGGRLPTVIARYGDAGPEYFSGLYGTENPALLEARRRALEKLLLGEMGA
jgi:hypothetical protein